MVMIMMAGKVSMIANCIDAFEHYGDTLKSISSSPLEIITIHPGKKEGIYPSRYFS